MYAHYVASTACWIQGMHIHPYLSNFTHNTLSWCISVVVEPPEVCSKLDHFPNYPGKKKTLKSIRILVCLSGCVPVVLLLPMIDVWPFQAFVWNKNSSPLPMPWPDLRTDVRMCETKFAFIHFTKLQNNHGFTTNSLSPPDYGIRPYGVDATFSDLVKVAELKGCSVRIQRREHIWVFPKIIWLVVSTHLKNIRQMGNLLQIVVKIKTIWNHHLVMGTPKSSILMFFFHEINHPFFVFFCGTCTAIFGNTQKKANERSWKNRPAGSWTKIVSSIEKNGVVACHITDISHDSSSSKNMQGPQGL